MYIKILVYMIDNQQVKYKISILFFRLVDRLPFLSPAFASGGGGPKNGSPAGPISGRLAEEQRETGKSAPAGLCTGTCGTSVLVADPVAQPGRPRRGRGFVVAGAYVVPARTGSIAGGVRPGRGRRYMGMRHRACIAAFAVQRHCDTPEDRHPEPEKILTGSSFGTESPERPCDREPAFGIPNCNPEPQNPGLRGRNPAPKRGKLPGNDYICRK